MIDFKPQKALHLYTEMDKKKPKCIGHDYAIFEKYDGWYGYLDLAEGIVRSRAGRPIPSCEALAKKIMDSTHRRHGVAIFEILVHGVKEFHELNGILNRTVGDYVCKDAYVKVHDLVTDFNMEYLYRHKQLLSTFGKDNGRTSVQVAQYLDVSGNQRTWQRRVEEVWERGGEGIILKRVEGVFSPDKRNYDLMKIKEEVTLDLLVTHLVIGEGKYENCTGALECVDSKGIVHRISGMTDDQRVSWWKDPKQVVGKVVEVRAMKVNTDGSLREPRFKAIRYDKSPQDID
jgi:hypothetical protein